MRFTLVAVALSGASLACASTSLADEPPAPAAPAPAATSTASASAGASAGADLTTLRSLRDRGILSEAEYQAAMKDMGDSAGDRAGDAPSVVFGKWATTFYGFVEADTIYDSTQSFNDGAGNAQVARSNGN